MAVITTAINGILPGSTHYSAFGTRRGVGDFVSPVDGSISSFGVSVPSAFAGTGPLITLTLDVGGTEHTIGTLFAVDSENTGTFTIPLVPIEVGDVINIKAVAATKLKAERPVDLVIAMHIV